MGTVAPERDRRMCRGIRRRWLKKSFAREVLRQFDVYSIVSIRYMERRPLHTYRTASPSNILSSKLRIARRDDALPVDSGLEAVKVHNADNVETNYPYIPSTPTEKSRDVGLDCRENRRRQELHWNALTLAWTTICRRRCSPRPNFRPHSRHSWNFIPGSSIELAFI